jgi:hypothetical protein
MGIVAEDVRIPSTIEYRDKERTCQVVNEAPNWSRTSLQPPEANQKYDPRKVKDERAVVYNIVR